MNDMARILRLCVLIATISVAAVACNADDETVTFGAASTAPTAGPAADTGPAVDTASTVPTVDPVVATDQADAPITLADKLDPSDDPDSADVEAEPAVEPAVELAPAPTNDDTSATPAKSLEIAEDVTLVEFVAETPNEVGTFLTVSPDNGPTVSAYTTYHSVMLATATDPGLLDANYPAPGWVASMTPDPKLRTPALATSLALFDALTPGLLADGAVVGAVGYMNTGGALSKNSTRLANDTIVASGADVVFVAGSLDGAFEAPYVDGLGVYGRDREMPMNQFLRLADYRQAGVDARTGASPAVVSVVDVRQPVAFLCGFTGAAHTCELADLLGEQKLKNQRPYEYGVDGNLLPDQTPVQPGGPF